MNVYALFPLIAIIAYIPLIVTTASSRPWQKKHSLFILFLSAATMWSLTDYIFRSNLLPQYSFLLFKLIVIIYVWMVVQFHCFTSSFFAPGQGRWLPFAYTSLAATIILAAVGIVPAGVVNVGDKLYPDYGLGIIFIAIPLLVLAGRNVYVFWRRLRILDNPVQYNQIVSLLFGIFILTAFTLAAFLPWGKEYPVSHFGNIINALVLSYATIRHQLVDIKFVLRHGLGWMTLSIIGVTCYWLLLVLLHNILRFELDTTATLAAVMAAILVAIMVYRLRESIFLTIGRVLGGPTYNSRQKLSDFTRTIHNVFSLTGQGEELLALVTRAIGCRKACLLFFEESGGDFTAQLVEPAEEGNSLSQLRLREDSPIVEYLKRERKPLAKDDLANLPEFLSLWQEEKEAVISGEVELFMPLISRDRLIGILVLDKKRSGRYSLEDFNLLGEVTERVAVSMEKEYLREQLGEREKELSVINRSSAIITSSFDIQRIYDSFIQELKQVVDVSWAAIILIEHTEAYFLALASEIGSAWQVGERIPLKGTALESVAADRQALVKSNLSQESTFTMEKYFIEQGVRSIIYLPLVAYDAVIGSLVVASRQANAYKPKQADILEKLSLQIAMPIKNSQLYAEAERQARVDGLTDLLNRQSLDAMITSEIGRHSRYGGVFSLIILDLDSFKAFNDSYGHLAGDELLSKVSGAMKGNLRGADQAFRYGGDEFAILLPQTNIEAAYGVAERIRECITQEVKPGCIPVTASLGLAAWPIDGVGVNGLIAAADKALFHAKRSGGNKSQRFSLALLPLDDSAPDYWSDDSNVLSTIYALAATVDVRDHYTKNHTKKVNKYAVALAEALNLETLEVSRVSTCAFLHDIGKVGVSDEILNKVGELTEEEWAVIKNHSRMGASVVNHGQQLAPCVPGILYHHERYDGTGYPEGLKGEDIPLEARILAVADAFAAMTSRRHYSPSLTHEQAVEELRRKAGTQFDPHLIEVFLRVIKGEHMTSPGQKIRR
ncbi:diguanylate cyclase [Chloroflexota bacterium]